MLLLYANATPCDWMISVMSTLSRTLTSLTEQDYRHVQWQAELKSEDWTL